MSIAWTKCSEKMPDDDESVLLACDDGEVQVGFLDAGTWRYQDAMPLELHGVSVTHWADLPAHPDDQRPDCRTCDRYAHYHSGHFCGLCTRTGVLVCINGSEYQPADPVRLYETGEA
jgi:hypothetical protein